MVRLGMSDKPRELRENPFPDFDFDRELRLCYEDFYTEGHHIYETGIYVVNLIWLCRPYEAMKYGSDLQKIVEAGELIRNDPSDMILAIRKYFKNKGEKIC